MNTFTKSIVPFDPSEQWPEPDMTIGNPVRPPAPVMSDEDFAFVFGPWAGWIKDAAETKNAPTDYVAASLLATASAAIGNSRWAVPWEGWKEPPVLWAMLVGDPSAGKSPALDAVIDPVREIERAFSEDYRRKRDEWEAENELANLALAQWKQDAKSALADGESAPAKPDETDAGEPPVRERICITDITTEKVADLLSRTWRGLLLARDELSGWLSSMDRYNGGGDRPFWLETYGGRSHSTDRKNSPDPIVVDHLSVAIVGGTQPDKLSALLVKCDDDGLLARFMTVFPDPVPLCRPSRVLDEGRMAEAIRQLRSLPPASDENGNRRPFYVYFTEEAADTLQEFREHCRTWEADATGLFKSHIGKMPGLVVRVANVLAHLDWATDPQGAYVANLDETHVGRACHFVGEYLRHHAFRAYGVANVPQEVRAAKAIAQIIQTEQPRSFKVRDIQKRGRTGLSTASEIKAALGVLLDADWLRENRGKSGGRPACTYMVNPHLGEGK
ncbi:MAG: YfjI family protein [Paracoccaceae bacterium]